METVLERIASLYQSKGKASSGKLKYERLYKAIKSGIIGNQIPPGLNLPPTRVLGEALQLSRTTVNRAYELLRLEGYIESHVGSGHQVKALSAASTGYSELTGRTSYPALSELGSSFLKNISLINSTDDNSIAFRPGLPPLDIFPVNRWKNLSNLYWRYIKTSALSYSPSAGLLQLKKNISAYLNLSRNIQCDPR
ncbi:MAG: GntR family transcriptional regulator, partial [Cryomorphaceae bacterium]